MTATTTRPTRLGDWTPGTPEWRAARANGIGGSEVAAVLGLSPDESRFSLWHRKAGNVGPVEQSDAMEWGHRLEAAVARKFFDEHPEFSDEGHTSAGTWTHPDRPWQIANPDRFVYLRRPDGDVDLDSLLEVKTARYGDDWGAEGTDEIPPYYRVQCLWYLDVLGLDRCHVAVLIAGQDYREYLVTYDPAEAEFIRTEVRAFLDTLDAGEAPSIDDHTATYQTIRELHPDIDGTDHELDDHIAATYIEARNRLAVVTAHEQHARSLVADAMGDAKTARWGAHVIARRQARKDGTPYVVAARNLPDLTGQTNRETP